MTELEKLLQKSNRKDRDFLLAFLKDVQSGNLKGINIKKVIGTNLYRARKGDFRIVFELKNTKVFVKRVSRKNEKTYSNM